MGGFLIEEFHVTELDSAAGISRRLIDGVIIDAKEIGSQVGGTKEIEGKDVISVQTKGTKLSMSLLGQALFSRDLLEMHKPRSIQSVAICASGDALLEEIAKKYGVKVVIIPDAYKNNDELISELKRDIT